MQFIVRSLRAILPKPPIFTRIACLISFWSDIVGFKKLHGNKNFRFKLKDIYPMIFDKSSHGIDYVYFYQDSWCAGKVLRAKPKLHVDVGSKAEMLGIISEIVPVKMVDIRPLEVSLSNLTFIEGDATKLPFTDNELESLSSICVIEHIGLGRYGDSLDPFGSEKAAAELVRVLAQGGDLYISVPVDSRNTIYFNAHRAFTREYVLKIFSPLVLVEEKYIYDRSGIMDKYNPSRGFGTGLFHFTKTSA